MLPPTQILFLFSSLIAIVDVAIADGNWYLALQERQQLGTPLYACHENCGKSITLSKSAGGTKFCTDEAFISAYNACLSCAGPENLDIWKIYGTSVSAAGKACGFATEPAGKTGTATTNTAPPANSTAGQSTASATALTSSAATTTISHTPYPMTYTFIDEQPTFWERNSVNYKLTRRIGVNASTYFPKYIRPIRRLHWRSGYQHEPPWLELSGLVSRESCTVGRVFWTVLAPVNWER
ncbi:MAG: hypothetical protein M1813_006525 [Trichoglossum hirsutum]|nr:MAG: hypothetical protein M1813_006525 [Trichoglossum hirsutum]